MRSFGKSYIIPWLFTVEAIYNLLKSDTFENRQKFSLDCFGTVSSKLFAKGISKKTTKN